GGGLCRHTDLASARASGAWSASAGVRGDPAGATSLSVAVPDDISGDSAPRIPAAPPVRRRGPSCERVGGALQALAHRRDASPVAAAGERLRLDLDLRAPPTRRGLEEPPPDVTDDDELVAGRDRLHPGRRFP